MAFPDALTRALNDVLLGGASARVRDDAAERALIAAAKEGSSEAFVQLVYAYGESLRTLVGRRYGNRHPSHKDYRPGYTTPDDKDLHAACVDALLVAMSVFDPAKHRRLAACLTMASDARAAADAALNVTNRSLNGVHVPDGSMRTFHWLRRRAEDAIREAEGREPLNYRETVEAAALIAQADPQVTLSADAVRDIGRVTDIDRTVSLDAPPARDEDGNELPTLADTLEDPDAVVPFAAAEAKLLAAQALAVLPEAELEVTRYAYGFPPESYREMSDGEVAEELKDTRGYSRSKVNRLRNKALGLMRDELGVTDPE